MIVPTEMIWLRKGEKGLRISPGINPLNDIWKYIGRYYDKIMSSNNSAWAECKRL